MKRTPDSYLLKDFLLENVSQYEQILINCLITIRKILKVNKTQIHVTEKKYVFTISSLPVFNNKTIIFKSTSGESEFIPLL